MSIRSYPLLKGALMLSLLLLSLQIARAQSCSWSIYSPYASPLPSYGGSCGSYIKYVYTTGGIQNLNGGAAPAASAQSGCSPNNYAYYSGAPYGECKANAGSSITLKVQTGGISGQANVRVWIDWDKDGTFDPVTEFITATPAQTSSYVASIGQEYSLTINVPNSAQNGLTRMRVRLGAATSSGNASYVGIPDACALVNNGETEDYDFEVVNPCLQPAVLSISNVTCNSADIAWSTRPNGMYYDVWVDKTLAPWSRPDAPDCSGSSYCPGGPPPGFPKCLCKWWHLFGPTATSTHLPGTVNGKLESDTKYYVCVRTVCDINQKPYWTWDTSAVWAIDSFTTLPCCYAPDPIKISNITPTSAVASWSPTNTANGYEYVVSTLQGDPVGGGTHTTFTSAFLPGLRPSTTYYLCVRSNCSPTPLSDWNCISFGTGNTTGIGGKVNKDNISLYAYPNPVKNEVTIELGGIFNGSGQLIVTDITGKVVSNATMEDGKATLQTYGWAPGLYFVRYTDRQNTAELKINKE